jgi:hypothetical protein
MMNHEDGFSCLCDPKMANNMDRVIRLAGGEITARDEAGFGVRLQIRKL